MMDMLRDQVLLALVKQSENNELSIAVDAVDAVDDTASWLLLLNVNNDEKVFTFKAVKKEDYMKRVNNTDKRLN